MFSYFSRLSETFKDVPASLAHADPAETAEEQRMMQTGILSSTLVATARGWQQIGDLSRGDKVLTFDAGLQTVTGVTREPLCQHSTACPPSCWPVEVPAGVLGNRSPMRLMPDQSIMVESDVAEDRYGDPFSLIPASALVGVKDIERSPPGPDLHITQLHFKQDQVIFGENGTLYFCQALRDLMDLLLEDREDDPMYSILPVREAQIIAKSLDGHGAATGFDLPQGIRGEIHA